VIWQRQGPAKGEHIYPATGDGVEEDRRAVDLDETGALLYVRDLARVSAGQVHFKHFKQGLTWYFDAFLRVDEESVRRSAWIDRAPFSTTCADLTKRARDWGHGKGAIGGAFLTPLMKQLLQTLRGWALGAKAAPEEQRAAGLCPKPLWLNNFTEELAEEYAWQYMTAYAFYARKSEWVGLEFQDLFFINGGTWKVQLRGAKKADNFRSKTQEGSSHPFASLGPGIHGLPSTRWLGSEENIMRPDLVDAALHREELERPIHTGSFFAALIKLSLTRWHGMQQWRERIEDAKSASDFLRQWKQEIANVRIFPRVRYEYVNRFAQLVAEARQWPRRSADGVKEYRYTSHGLRAAPATVALCLLGLPVEEVMHYGNWAGADVAGYAQEEHPTLAEMRRQLGTLQVRPGEPRMAGHWRQYQSSEDVIVLTASGTKSLQAVMTVLRRLQQQTKEKKERERRAVRAAEEAPGPAGKHRRKGD
jgi:hypothetical protein